MSINSLGGWRFYGGLVTVGIIGYDGAHGRPGNVLTLAECLATESTKQLNARHHRTS